MTEHESIIDYLKSHYGHRNVMVVNDSTARIRIKGVERDIDLNTFIPFSTTKADTLTESYG